MVIWGYFVLGRSFDSISALFCLNGALLFLKNLFCGKNFKLIADKDEAENISENTPSLDDK